jgi:UDP-N-acetylglucosamine 2-epimerase
MAAMKKVMPDFWTRPEAITAMIVALDSSYCEIPVGHVEAGLRSSD